MRPAAPENVQTGILLQDGYTMIPIWMDIMISFRIDTSILGLFIVGRRIPFHYGTNRVCVTPELCACYLRPS